jgi:hypothetical protein
MAFHERLMTQAQFQAYFSGAVIIAEQNHLDIRMQQLPALQGVPLNDSVVAMKRLRGSKESQHL